MDSSSATTNTEPEYFTKAEIAKRFRRSPKTIAAWTKSIGLPHVKLGRSILFPRKSVENFIADRTVGTHGIVGG